MTNSDHIVGHPETARSANPDHRSDELVVVAVRANPEPDDGLAVNLAESAVGEADSHGVDVVLLIDLLEVQPRVGRVLPEQPVGSAGL